jgi:hypothetical protein
MSRTYSHRCLYQADIRVALFSSGKANVIKERALYHENLNLFDLSGEWR